MEVYTVYTVHTVYTASCVHILDTRTGWQGLIGCLKLQVVFRKRATNYRALLRNMTWRDKASCDSTPTQYDWVMSHIRRAGWLHAMHLYTIYTVNTVYTVYTVYTVGTRMTESHVTHDMTHTPYIPYTLYMYIPYTLYIPPYYIHDLHLVTHTPCRSDPRYVSVYTVYTVYTVHARIHCIYPYDWVMSHIRRAG